MTEDVHFLTRSHVNVGGTKDASGETEGMVKQNFEGALGNVRNFFKFRN